MIDSLKKALHNLEHLFQPNELAYLALTQKVEHAVRDKLAYSLFRDFESNPSLLVCREWNRCDLAVLERNGILTLPRMLIEAKAVYSFDILKTGARYPFWKLIENDLIKSKRLIDRKSIGGYSPESVALVIVTHPHNPPDIKYREALKYFAPLSRCAQNPHDFVTVGIHLDQFMLAMDKVHCCEISAGTAFGVKVSLFFWLYRLSSRCADGGRICTAFSASS